ncbi:AraC family transcriptional regulator [Streptomyces sp. NPDC047022]|uniref:AraC family transcriptional regulator n=1 Tax=Streptomyces sp. NPDC047022 TaxID=3155737 RepID=UPI0033E4A4B6
MAAIAYREERLHDSLSEWVECAWFYERTLGTDEVEDVVPDACVELVVQLGAPFRDDAGPLPECVAIGTSDRPLRLVADGRVAQWSVRFPWWGLAPFGDVRVFRGRQWAPADEVFATHLVGEVSAAARSTDPVSGFNRALLAQLWAWTTPQDDLRIAGQRIAGRAAGMSVESLAEACALSQRQLQRNFRAALGSTPQQMIARMRFERARRLLMASDDPLADVAIAAGYADHSHMSRAFASFARMTPSAYRRQFRAAAGGSGSDVALIQDTTRQPDPD